MTLWGFPPVLDGDGTRGPRLDLLVLGLVRAQLIRRQGGHLDGSRGRHHGEPQSTGRWPMQRDNVLLGDHGAQERLSAQALVPTLTFAR